MRTDTIKITKFFWNYLKEQAWLEQMAQEGYKLRNITGGLTFEFEKIEPTRLVYEIERFNLSTHPTYQEINERKQFLEMVDETDWEIVCCDETLTYYLCKPYVEHDSNELYNDAESRKVRAGKFRNILLDMSQSIMRFALAINLISLFLYAIEGFKTEEMFVRVYLVFALGYSALSFIMHFAYRKLADSIYAELCMSKEEWQQKYNDTTENVKKCRKFFVRSKSFVKYINKQAAEGWYLSGCNMFSYTFTRHSNLEQPAEVSPLPSGQRTVYYVIENKRLISKRLKQMGLTLEKNKKDYNGLGFEWLEQSVSLAEQNDFQYVTAYQKQYVVYAINDANKAQEFQKKNIFVSWLSYGYAWFVIACGLLGGIIGFIAGVAH